MKQLRSMAALAAAIVAFVLMSVAYAPAASAKSFRIAGVEIQAVLESNASMRVVEHITYDFSGQFHHGTRPIPPGDYELTDMTVSEAGVPLPFDGAPYNLSWSFSASNERRTFDIAYTVQRAAKVGPDVGELFWKWIGDAHPGVGVVRVALTVPGDGEGVRAWAHGPLDGRVQPEGRTVLFSVDDLPAGQFVEGRVAVPAGAFSEVIPTGGERLPAILSEEGQLADRANAERAADARRQAQLDDLRRVANRVFPIVPILGWIGFILVWLRWGREYKTDHDVGEYQREPFDDPPAVVPTLFAWGTVPDVAVSATLVDLAQRGYMTIEEVKTRAFLHDRTDWKFTAVDKPMTDLRAFESILLEQLFAEGSPTTQHDFTEWAKHHRTEADRWYRRFKMQVARDFASRKYIEGGKAGAYALNFLIAGAVLAVSLFLLTQGVVIALLGILSAVVQLALSALLRRRTRAGRQRLAEWKAFEHFLRDFSQLEEAPVASMVIWERYLVYAVALGITAQVARALEARIPRQPDGSMQPGFAPWFIGYHGAGAFESIGGLSEFAHSFGPTIAAAVAPPSSSSSGFGGGGFSGGGGGGGGGGGMGAS